MINSLDNKIFFPESDLRELRKLRLAAGTDRSTTRLSFAALMLAPVMELSVRNRVTTPNEFEAIEEYLKEIEHDFELAPKEELEAIGTEMGMLPMIKGTWRPADFHIARNLLAEALDRLTEKEAHAVRNAIAKALLNVARAGGGHLITLHVVDSENRPMIHEIVQSLKLDTTSEGLNLIGKTGG